MVMKFLLVLFCVVFAVSSAAPLDTPDSDLIARNIDDFFKELVFEAEDNENPDVDNEQLREDLKEILEKIREAIVSGQSLKEEVVTKVKELLEKLKEAKGDFLVRIKEQGRDYLKKILQNLGLSKRAIDERSDAILESENESLEDVQKQLKERLEEVLKKIKDAIDQGKAVREDMLTKLKELRKKMKDMNFEVGNKSKEILERIKEKGRDFLKEILEKLGLGYTAAEERARDIVLQVEIDSEVIDQLKTKFVELVKNMREAFKHGKVSADFLEKVQDLCRELNKLEGTSGEFFEKIKNIVTDYWRKLKENLKSKRSADIDVFGMIDHLKELIKEKFNPDRLKQIVEKYLDKEVAEQLIGALKEKGEKRKQLIIEWINRVFGNKDEKRSYESDFDQAKAFFLTMGFDLEQNQFVFGKWAMSKYQIDNAGKMAKMFLDDTGPIRKQVATRALSFFLPFEEQLGNVFDEVEAKVFRIVKQPS